jgi:hypothetical protein
LTINPGEELETDAARRDRQRCGGIPLGFRGNLERRLNAIATFFDANPWAIFVATVVPYLVYLATHARARPLWHDELYTYYIAQAPTLSRMLKEASSIDLNPPLYYMMARFVFRFLHPSSLSVRLPSMIGFFLAACLSYAFVRRRFTPIYGLLGALVLLGSVYKDYAFEARPYALVLAFLAVAAIGWQRAIEENGRFRWLAMLLLILGGFGMLLSHVLALIAYGAFFFAETVRFCIRRKYDWLLWACLFLPLTTVALYAPLLRSHGGGAFPSEFQASLSRLSDNYLAIWTSLAPLLATAMIAIILVGVNNAVPSDREDQRNFSGPEWSFTGYLLFVPFLVTVIFMRSHSAYFDRYGIPSIFGASILVPGLIGGWTRTSRTAGLVAAFIFAFGVVPPIAFVTYGQRIIHRPQQQYGPDLTGDFSTPLNKVEESLPFVDASGLTFLEMDSREDKEFLSRVYYLDDPQAAIRYSHASIFNGLGALKSIFPIRANIAPYQNFIRQHPRFLVYGTVDYPEDWLLRKLLADGASVRYLGNFVSGYKDSSLYEVTLPPQ